MQRLQRTERLTKLRALLPLLCCIFLGGILLVWQYHRTQASRARITFEVHLEGERLSSYHATLNGILGYQSGFPCGVGSKTLHVEAPNAEPFETNMFVWYSGAPLGTISLPHSRGTLTVDIAPSPNRVSIRGERFQKELVDCSQQAFQVPVGQYEIISRFERFSRKQSARVERNSAATVSIKPSIATLELKAEPSAAEFRLQSTPPEEISVDGRRT